MPPALALHDVTAFLDDLLGAERFGEDVRGALRASTRPLARLGLALEPAPDLPRWARENDLDALLLHRPWGLETAALTPGVGVLAYHHAFDEALTLGYNPWMARALALAGLDVFGEKAGRPLGMVGRLPAVAFPDFTGRLRALFGGLEAVHPPARKGAATLVTGVAVVGAMNDRLVRAAHAWGADTYVTGQYRQPARAAVLETGIGVCVVGHARAERWGLGLLQRLLAARFGTLRIEIYPGHAPDALP